MKAPLAAAALACAALAALLFAGPLNPPAGPVSSTYKTLVDVEPRTGLSPTTTPGDADALFVISQPGSYYLRSSFTGVPGKGGIKIAASGVTLDLMGFEVAGVPGSTAGIFNTTSGLTNITVTGGAVRAWGTYGIDLYSHFTTGGRLADLLASDNTFSGIKAGLGYVVERCAAHDNGGTGIDASGGGCTLRGCDAYANGSTGYYLGGACAVSVCFASGNGGTGFFVTGDGCTIADSASGSNTGDGFFIDDGNTISRCTARSNQGAGISASSECHILQNTCSRNATTSGGGAGISVTGNYNRVEGNNCPGFNDVGIKVTSFRNLILRNSCAANTINWSVAAGNALAPIVNASTNAAAVSGNTYSGSLGSTDPSANFTY